MAQSGQIQTIYNSRKTLLEHLKYQGFDVQDYENSSINEIYEMSQNQQLDMLIERKSDADNKITKKKTYIKYHLAKRCDKFLNALNSNALPEGSLKNMVACSPDWPSNFT